MSSANIPVFPVTYWKSKGFTFEHSNRGVGCTDVRFGGKPFSFFKPKFVSNVSELAANLEALEPAKNNEMIAAGQFEDDDEFPFFLVNEQSLKLLSACNERRQSALNEATRALSDFGQVLTG